MFAVNQIKQVTKKCVKLYSNCLTYLLFQPNNTGIYVLWDGEVFLDFNSVSRGIQNLESLCYRKNEHKTDNRASLNQTELTQLIFDKESLTYRVYEDKTMAGLVRVTGYKTWYDNIVHIKRPSDLRLKIFDYIIIL